MTKIAALLTCHNRKVKTLKCLESLFGCDLNNANILLEVFLVDDGSTDGTGESVREKYAMVHLINGNGELYWNRGMHLAWKKAAEYADFDYYLWVNDDVVLFRNSITNLLDADLSALSIIVGATQSEQTGEITYGGRDKAGRLIVPNGNTQQCVTINGNLVLVPRSVFKKVGNLDPVFPHAIGDFDYALRAKKLGVSCLVSTHSCGYCERNASLPLWCIASVPFTQRLRSLYSPLGNSHPRYYFIFTQRHYGISTSIKHFLSIHLRLIYPKLWRS